MGCGGSKEQQKQVKEPAAEAASEKKEVEVTLLPEQGQEKKDAEEPKLPAVKVEIVSARGLRNADWLGTSEPFCAVQLVGPKPESRLETKTHENYKEPAWNVALEVPGYTPGDALSLTVKDQDPLKPDDILGKVVLTEAQVKEGFDGELQLAETGEGVEAFIKIKVAGTGTIAAKMEEAKDKVEEKVEKAAEAAKEAATGKEKVEAEAPKVPTVKVEIVSARGLRNADWMGTSEPYCIVEFVGPKPESKLETKTHENYKEPAWNVALEVPDYTPGDALHFTVKDKDTLKDDILGKVVLTEAQVKEGFDGELQLTETGEGVEAFIKVKVAAMGTIAAKVEQAMEEAKEKVEEAMEKPDEAGAEVVEDTQGASKSTGCCM